MRKYILAFILLIGMLTVFTGCGNAKINSQNDLNSKDITKGIHNQLRLVVK